MTHQPAHLSPGLTAYNGHKCRCEDCKRIARNYQQRRYARLVKAGKCRRCGEPRSGLSDVFCDVCLTSHRDSARKRNGYKGRRYKHFGTPPTPAPVPKPAGIPALPQKPVNRGVTAPQIEPLRRR